MNRKKIIILIVILIILFCLSFFIINNINKKDRYNQKILFLGDSIIERYDLKKYYKKYTNIINSGVGGNQSIDILNDLDNRVYKYKPEKIIILVGTNDIAFSGLDNASISKNIEKIINNIHKKLPNTKIYVQSVYPVNYNVNKDIVANRTNDNIKDLNKKIKKICEDNKCTYINMYDTLIDNKGILRRIYTTDGLHINRVGYRIITIKLLKYINE